MIIIDKRLETQRLVVTVSENSTDADIMDATGILVDINTLLTWETADFTWDGQLETNDPDVELPSAAYQLVIHSDFSLKTYSKNLPDNSSIYSHRYDEFLFDTVEILSWESGFYTYVIREINGAICEVGNLLIIDGGEDITPPFISIEKPEYADDYVVYNKTILQ